jgi:hypothetical protein
LEILFKGGEVRDLYVTGRSSRFDDSTVISFFAAVEAIEACSSLPELRAIGSLAVSTTKRHHELRLAGGVTLLAQDHDGRGGDPSITLLSIEPSSS